MNKSLPGYKWIVLISSGGKLERTWRWVSAWYMGSLTKRPYPIRWPKSGRERVRIDSMWGKLYRLCPGEARGPPHCLEFSASVGLIYMLLSVVMNRVRVSSSQRDCFWRKDLVWYFFMCFSVPALNIDTQDGSINIVEGNKELWEGRWIRRLFKLVGQEENEGLDFGYGGKNREGIKTVLKI